MCTDNCGNRTLEEPPREQSAPADYDKAVSETGYGLFNVLMLLAALPIGWTCIIDTTSTAFIINSTECIFELTMLRRGIAFASVFIGMIISGPVWDFVLQDYIIGRLGRRNVMIIAIFLNVIFNFFWIHATSYYVFIILKILSGILIAGPLSVLMAYLSEFHAPTYQKEFTRWAGLLVGISYIIPAVLAVILFLQKPWSHFTIYNYFYPTWRVYLIICAIPSILGFITLTLMPKSPKFLMSQGKNQEALRLFRVMYCFNKFESLKNYPITELNSSQKSKTVKANFKENTRKKFYNLKILFSKPHLKTFLTIIALQFGSMFGFHVMRLWVPPLFVILNNFRVLLRSRYPKNELITMCEMIFPRDHEIDRSSCNYTWPSVESAVYVNSTIIATSAVSFGFIFSLIFTTKTRRKFAMTFLFLLSAVGAFASNWSVEIPYMLVLLAFVIVGCRIAGNHILAHTSEVIPTTLRPSAISMINLIGNFGAVVGNIIFFFILEIDCIQAFFLVGFLTSVCAITVPFCLTERKTDETKAKEIEIFTISLKDPGVP